MTNLLTHSDLFRRLRQTMLLSCVAAGIASVPLGPAWAGSISAQAVSKSGEAMPDVVVFAMPVGRPAPPSAKTDIDTIAQRDMQFTPYVSVIRVGTEIKFPNYDKVEHHVKSFSPAKEFEIKPYQKVTPPPVIFDKTGIIVVYCLLHEWMRAYVMVVDTPYFGKSEAAGTVTLDNLPEGKYEIRAWHPDMGTVKMPLLQTVQVAATGAQLLKFNFDFNPRKRKMAKAETTAGSN